MNFVSYKNWSRQLTRKEGGGRVAVMLFLERNMDLFSHLLRTASCRILIALHTIQVQLLASELGVSDWMCRVGGGGRGGGRLRE